MKAKKILSITMAFFTLFTLAYPISSAVTSVITPNVAIVPTEAEIVTSTSSLSLSDWASVTSIQTVVNSDGSISIMDVENAIVYEYDSGMKFTRLQKFEKVLPMVGAFVKDTEGQYYVLYAAYAVDKDEKNMALIKYSEGKNVNEYWLTAGQVNNQEPFAYGSCRLELSGNLIAAYFAREMFARAGETKGHQSSFGFILDKDTFQRVSAIPFEENPMPGLISTPEASHSLNQFVFSVKDGFIFVDHSDASPSRSFVFTKVTANQKRFTQKSAFVFAIVKDEYQKTYAEGGGIVQTADGFLFVGTYNKSAPAEGARNLFVINISEDLGFVSNPIWLTNYNTDALTAASPKIVQIGNNEYLILYEQLEKFATGTEWRPYFYRYHNTHGLIVDKTGNVLKEFLVNGRLNSNDILRYNPKTQEVAWATNEGDNIVRLYSFDPIAEVGGTWNVDSASPWARPEIIGALDKGFVPYEIRGEYQAVITRAEFCKLTTQWVAYRMEKSIDTVLSERNLRRNPQAFTDTYDPDILAAFALGITSGTKAPTDSEPGLFSPNGHFTRQEMATMIMRACKVIGMNIDGTPTADFADMNIADSWAHKGINFVRANNIMGGTNTNTPTFSPKGLCTRQESIVTLDRIK